MTYRHAVVTGAGGFIGGHLVRRLVADNWNVAAVDTKPAMGWHQPPSYAVGDFSRIDAGDVKKYRSALDDADVVFHLAANMGGMGYIESHLVDCAENIGPTMKLLRVIQPGQKFFFSSSACVYPQFLQSSERFWRDSMLREIDAYPADPEPGYGWEKLYAEQLISYHAKERGIVPHIARFHNSYGPYGTWKGGREKAPAALCRKVAEALITGHHEISVWGDGTQRRSFMYIDDNVEGIMRLLDVEHKPVNLGSSEAVTIEQLARLIIEIAFGDPDAVKINYEPGPLGVASRCSDNTYIKSLLSWEPSIPLRDGLEKTYKWIHDQIVKEK